MRISALKRVIITGGAGGFGSAISSRFRDAGADTTALGRKDLDLADDEAVKAYFSENSCDLLVCAAGIIRDQPLKYMEEQKWDEIFRVNFTAAKNCALAALPSMVERNGGHVVFISSYAAVHPAVGQAAYAAAKASLLGLTKDLAAAYGEKGIRVNALMPGFLETAMTETVSEKRKSVVRDLHFLKEFNTTDAAADFLWFLDERMPWTSGQIFQLDSRP